MPPRERFCGLHLTRQLVAHDSRTPSDVIEGIAFQMRDVSPRLQVPLTALEAELVEAPVDH